MKGLLLRTSKFPGIGVMPKRRRSGVSSIPKKKSRESQGLDDQSMAKEDEMPIDPYNQVETDSGIRPQLVTGSEEEVPVGQRAATPVSYDADKATVTLQVEQMVALDGWAIVRLLAGRAAVHGYNLCPGVDVLLCSNSKLAAVVAIGSASSEMLDILEEPGTFGCSLEFQSYRGGSAESGPSFDSSSSGEALSKRTFRIEICGEHERLVRKDTQKRKRDEAVGGENSLSERGEADEEDSWSSGDVDEEDEEVKMEVDDLLDADNMAPVKSREEARSPLTPTVIPDSWWGAANSIIYQCEANPSSQGSEMSPNRNSFEQTHSAQIVAVIGPKNTGKSTFARFLINSLLNSHEAVGYLDTDVGQPEFTVPGCLSLHIISEPIFGSPVLHLRNPERFSPSCVVLGVEPILVHRQF